METRDDELEEDIPPGWALGTPARRHEVWTVPLLAAVLAVSLIVVEIVFGDRFTATIWIPTAAVVAGAAVVLFVTGRTAHDEQTLEAAWRAHVAPITTGVTVAVAVASASLVVGASVGVAVGVLGTTAQVFRFARSVPRIDRLTLAWGSVVTGSVAIVLVLLGVALPDVPQHRVSVWVGGGGAVALVSVVVAVVQFRRAASAPRR